MQLEQNSSAGTILTAASFVAFLSGAATICTYNDVYAVREQAIANAVAWNLTTSVIQIEPTSAWTTNPSQLAPEMKARILRLLDLKDNWNSYSAKRVNPRNIQYAIELFASLRQKGTPIPSLVPMSSGGVQMEWHTRGIDLEIVIDNSPFPKIFYEDMRTGESWKGELDSNLTKLNGYLKQLSRRT